MISIVKYIIYLILGLIECFGLSLNTKFRQRNKKAGAFLTSFINILIWGTVLSTFIQAISKSLLCTYALGFAIGDVLAIIFDNYLEKLAKIRGLSF